MERAIEPVFKESLETRRLLDAAQAGSRKAFEQLFNRHRKSLGLAIAVRLDARLNRRLDPSDIVQETQLEAFRRLSDYLKRRPMPFHLWLRKTAEERLIMARRRHIDAARRGTIHEVQLPDRSSLTIARRLLDGAPSPSQQAASREMAQRVRQCIAQLPDADREILIMRNFEALSNQEVACLLEMEAKSVSKRHTRALLRLRRMLVAGGLKESAL